MKNIYLLCLVGMIMGVVTCTEAQTALQPFDQNIYHWLDRFDILYSNPNNFHTSIKQSTRGEIIETISLIDSSNGDISDGDRGIMQWLVNHNNHWLSENAHRELEYVDSSKTFYAYRNSDDDSTISPEKSKRPIIRHFYRTPAHFFEVEKKDFFLRVNPLFQFRMANASNDDFMTFENQRGINIHGGIDEKIYFHTVILESQARYPVYVDNFRQKFKAVPGAGFVKNYNSRIFDFNNGVDYLLANAYVGLNVSRHVNLELGHGRHFIGNGLRSLFLSDFSTDYFYLKLNTRVWKFHYQNIFGELTRPERGPDLGDRLLPKKYFAAHYLSLNILPTLNVGLFETVVFAREDQFELQYLNPVILYRTVEGAIGSPDNVLLGLDIKWNVLKKASLYTQFVLDEFKISEVTAGTGWWANKYGLQIGLKYLDLFGVDQLDAQIEYNLVRPYTYSHNTGIANYSHYNQSLAHPLGGNFRESLLQVRYQPTPKWSIVLRAISMQTGEDRDTFNFGSNILLPNNDRVSDFGNEIGQGVSMRVNMIGVDISYQLRQGLFLDLFYQSRKGDSEDDLRDLNNNYLGAGVRWNLGRRWMQF